MDFAGQKIKPAEGMLAVRFVDDDEDEDEKDAANTGYAEIPSEPKPYEGCLAVVAGVGDKVKVKNGATIVTSPWARDGLKIGAGLVLINAYDVKATLLD